jgi:hypothetical protein
MKKIFRVVSTILAALALHATTKAEPSAPPLSASDRSAVLQTLAAELDANYVFADVAARIEDALASKAASFADATTAVEFADRLTTELRAASNDKHFRVFFDPDFHQHADLGSARSPDELEEQRAEVAQMAYGIEKVQRLPGNIAYIELRGFGPTELIASAYASAMALVQGSEAMILDLRRNGGGSPDSVALWLSYFFPMGDERHLNDLYTRRTDATQQFWTTTAVGQRYTKPVYVLTSPRTFSGGEEAAYDFQTQKRATLIGETTGGGAHAGDRFELGHGLVVNIPTARAINPITHTNWERVGVKPDIEVPAAQAQQVAYAESLRSQIARSTDPHDIAQLRKWLDLAEKGETAAPIYSMPR